MVATKAAAAKATPRGLSTKDVDAIRDGLAAGRKPRVIFTDSAGQIAGQTGQVVALTDPDGADDFVVVRFGRDELPFSPTDLAIAPRGSTPRRAEPARPAPELKMTEPPVPAPREETSMPTSTVDTSAVDTSAAAPAEEPATKPRKAAGRAARPKAPAALTVTLSYTEGEWTVAANQGSKALAKPYIIKPAEALKMVSLLDVPGVQEAVEHIVSAERDEVQSQAERLRAELAEIEAKLADLTELR